MPAPPPPIKKSNASMDTIDVDLDFNEDRSGSRSRAIAADPRNGNEGQSTPSLEGVSSPVSSGPSSRSDVYAAGDLIANKFRLKSIIGRGGMGSVWLAHNLALDIDIAIKLIRRDRAAPGAAGRLRQEAQAAARLRHPAIVRVTDFGETERGDPYIVMELLHGEPLSTIIARKGRLSPIIAVQTLLPVASALVEAHAKGIVHRDLKPDNILLVTDESGAVTPKVVDFGIAKLMYTDVDRQLTMAGEVLGSPDYMSPEQARGDEDVGEGTDVWALSVVLYEAITGRRPFDGPNYNALIAAILTANPMPAGEFSDCDGDLWSVLARGLDKDDRSRWPTMRDLGTALAAWVVERGIEDDVTGTSIAKQWLIGRSRRLFTVFPEGEAPPMPSRPSMEPPVPSGRPSVQDRLSFSDRPSIPSQHPSMPGLQPVPGGSQDQWAAPHFRPSRAPWIVLAAVAALGVIGFLAFTMLSPRGPSSDDTAASAAASTTAAMAAGAQPSAGPSAEASSDPRLASPPATSGSAKAAGTGTATAKIPRPKAPTAPKVPKHIDF